MKNDCESYRSDQGFWRQQGKTKIYANGDRVTWQSLHIGQTQQETNLYISQFQCINILIHLDQTNCFGGIGRKVKKIIILCSCKSVRFRAKEKETGNKVVHLAICNFGLSELNRIGQTVWALKGKNLSPYVFGKKKKKFPLKAHTNLTVPRTLSCSMVQPSGPSKVEAFVLERAPSGEMLSWCNLSTLCHHVRCEPHSFK